MGESRKMEGKLLRQKLHQEVNIVETGIELRVSCLSFLPYVSPSFLFSLSFSVSLVPSSLYCPLRGDSFTFKKKSVFGGD